MVGVTHTRNAMAVLTEIVVVALLALPAGTADGVQANIAINVAVGGF